MNSFDADNLEEIIERAIDYKLKFYQTYEGKVENNIDPEQKGRVQISIHSLGWITQDLWIWAEPEFANRGSFIVPAIGDEIKIYFQDADPEKPVYRGYFYYLNENPIPETDAKKGILIHTKNTDIKIYWDDNIGELNIDTTGNLNLNTIAGNVTVKAALTGTVTLETDIAGIGKIVMNPSGVTLGQGLGGLIACVGTNFVTTLLGPQPILPGVNVTNKA